MKDLQRNIFSLVQQVKWFNFFHFMMNLEDGPCIKKRLTGCGAGCEYLAITPYGDIYPCHQFAGDSKYKLGNVMQDEFSLEISKLFAKKCCYKQATM